MNNEIPKAVASIINTLVPWIREPLAEYYRTRREISSAFLTGGPFIFNLTIDEKPTEITQISRQLLELSNRLVSLIEIFPAPTFLLLRALCLIKSKRAIHDGCARLTRISNVNQIRQKKEAFWIRVLHDDTINIQRLLGIYIGAK